MSVTEALFGRLGGGEVVIIDGGMGSQYATAWADRGAQIIGCCRGVGPGHIQLLASQLPRRRQG
jgi:hypothetical protein